MSIRTPSATPAQPAIVTLRAGALLHRVHDRNFAAGSFNPCKGAPTRFAPIDDVNENCIPSLYAADTLETAIFETIFHDLPAEGGKRRTVPKTLEQSRAHGQLKVLRDLDLASLRSPDLRRWRISRNSLLASSPKLYPATASWARAIHHQFTNVQGLIRTSNQCDPDTAYLFFGDRVGSKDFQIICARDRLVDPGFLADVRRAGRRSGISITA